MTGPVGKKTFATVRTGFERHGLSFGNSCRVAEYERAIRAGFDGHPNPKYPSDELILHALAEMKQFRLIAKYLCSESLPQLKDKLCRAMGGQVDPSSEGVNSPARDTQFELYAAAFFRASGFNVCFDEPDIIVEVGGARVAVAAKRLRSEGKLRRNIRRAIEQTIRASRAGIIAVEISSFGGVTSPLVSDDPLTLRNDAREKGHRFSHRVLDMMANQGMLKSQAVTAVLICHMTRALIAENMQPSVGVSWDMLHLPGVPAERQAVAVSMRRQFYKGPH